MLKLKAKIDFDRTLTDAEALKKAHFEKGGLVQQSIDKSVIDWDLQYAPWDTGTLAKSPYSVTEIGSGEVIYPGPYARYLYYGEVMGPNIPVFDDNSGIPTRFWSPPGKPKKLTGRQLQYNTDINPLAGSFWFARMKADHKDDIVKEAQRVAGLKKVK